ncbi:MAG: PEGA domain-containing protein [Verrucomicrobiota bacterium]
MNMKRFKNLLMGMVGLGVGLLVFGCASVMVTSTPEEAKVYLKETGELIGTTPAKVMLYANTQEVVVRKGGYFSKTVPLSPVGSAEVAVKLNPRGKVYLLSKPSGADVYLEGEKKRVGSTPYEVNYNSSNRTFVVLNPSYKERTVTISDDPEGNVMVELERQPTLLVESNPKNVTIYDNVGRRLGVTPLAVPAYEGAEIEFRKEGYHSRRVSVGPDTPAPYMVKLEREPIIIIYSEPEGAIVVHRGVTMGRTPYRRLVKNGELELEICADRYYTKKVTLDSNSPRKVLVKLDSKPYITVKSNPANAELFRSGGVELIGTTPVEVLVEKDTAFEMHREGYDIKPFMLSSDSSREVTVPLRQSRDAFEKTILIDSKPSGAAVYRLGGAELIGTTPLKQHVRSERTFELQLAGFKTKIVTVAPDSASSIVFALARDGSARNNATSDPLLNTPSSF